MPPEVSHCLLCETAVIKPAAVPVITAQDTDTFNSFKVRYIEPVVYMQSCACIIVMAYMYMYIVSCIMLQFSVKN